MKLQDQICATLREDILACRLLPGTELREQALAVQLGVSKSPVREALLRLTQERLVAVRPRQGYHVAPVSLTVAADLLELRRVLELACIRSAAARATPAQRDEIERVARYSGDAEGFIAYNRQFHTLLAACCGNAPLAQAASDAIAQTDRLVRLSLGMLADRDPERLVDEHADLAGAVAAGNGRRATRLLRSHLQAAETRILATLCTSTNAATSGRPTEETSPCRPRPTR